MTPEQFSRIRLLFDRAMDLPVDDRLRFVDRQTPPGDPVRDDLLAMIEAGDDSEFLARASQSGLLETVTEGREDLPSRIGVYKILRPLGRGGMGVVYMAFRDDEAFQKVVALKVIGDIASTPDIDFVQRFRQESNILARLEHPNIARILDGGKTDDGRPFFVMEYVAGSPIDKYCARMNIDAATRVRLMAQVCDAVGYLHSNAVAHRDIKPHNILVTVDGAVKLVDFGIAKVEGVGGLLRGAPPGAEPTMIMTPGYASPEQISGDGSGRAGDIYSIAVVLYQLLTGRLPHAGRDGQIDLDARVSGTPPDPPSKELTKAPTAPRLHDTGKISVPDLDRVVLTALERNPTQRYSTVQLFGEDLRRCLDGRPIAARPATVAYRARKLLARNPAIAAVAALAMLVAGAGLWMFAGARLERVRVEAKEQELERFVDLLAQKVATWQPGGAGVPVAERIADLQAAKDLLAGETMRTLADRAGDPPRVKRAIATLGQVLERADTVSQDQPALRKEIALVFRTIGDIGSSARVGQLANRTEAAQSYQRAAAIAANLRGAERAWADQQLAELTGRMNELGVTLDATLYTDQAVPLPEPPPTPEPAAVPAASARRVPPPVETALPQPVRELSPEEAAALEAVQQRLRTTELSGERARRNFETLRDTLASRGQTLRSDVEATLVAAEQLIEDARGSLDANDVMTAEDALRRAGYQLDRVFQAVGR